MNTYEARQEMLALAQEVQAFMRRMQESGSVQFEDRQMLRRALREARALLPDAGYPAEAAWRGMQRASIGLETALDSADHQFWQDVCLDLQAGIETLESLVSINTGRESDFHIIG